MPFLILRAIAYERLRTTGFVASLHCAVAAGNEVAFFVDTSWFQPAGNELKLGLLFVQLSIAQV